MWNIKHTAQHSSRSFWQIRATRNGNFTMQTVAATFSVLISLDRSVAAPVHRQIYDAFVAKIADGTLRSGQQVPLNGH